MKSKNLLILSALVMMLILPQCSKDKEQDLKNILTSKSWRLISETDIEGAVPLWECDIDDCYRFNPDGTMTFEKGQIDCDDSQYYDLGFYTWSLTENDLTITFNGNQNYDIDITEDKVFVSCLIGSLTFVPCSDNSYLEEIQHTKELLLGRWDMVSVKSLSNGKETIENFTSGEYFYEFKKDGAANINWLGLPYHNPHWELLYGSWIMITNYWGDPVMHEFTINEKTLILISKSEFNGTTSTLTRTLKKI